MRQQRPADSRDRLLVATRTAFLPVAILGVFVALRVPQTGILLTLAFDLMLAALVVPFLLGLFWRRASTAAAVAAITAGCVVRLGLFALTPTMYGVENTLLYIPNTLVGPGFDGWPTFLGVTASLAAFVLAALAGSRRRAEADTSASAALASLHARAEVAAPTEGVP